MSSSSSSIDMAAVPNHVLVQVDFVDLGLEVGVVEDLVGTWERPGATSRTSSSAIKVGDAGRELEPSRRRVRQHRVQGAREQFVGVGAGRVVDAQELVLAGVTVRSDDVLVRQK
jgi:hypothetical protein